VGGILLISFSVEINRSPFDFMEGESELVSGFNVEVGGGLFAFVFIGEYLLMLFFAGFCRSLVGGKFFLFFFLFFF